jgi:pumilio family protein 6
MDVASMSGSGDEEQSDQLETQKKGVKRKASDAGLVDKGEARKKQKLKIKEKKMAKPNAEMVYEAKKLWEQVRQKKIENEKRKELVGKLIEVVEGKIHDVVFKSDASRVIQCILKHGNEEHRKIVFNELKDHIVALATNNYGRFLLMKMLKYGTKEQRNTIIRTFYGFIRKQVKHRNASEVIEYIFTEIATVQQRNEIMEEFYGLEYSTFKTYDNRTLETILEKNPERKEEILKFMNEYFSALIDQENLSIRFDVIHAPLLKYFQHANHKQVVEMANKLSKILPLILHTRNGSKLCLYCINYGAAKDRKAIIKSFKGLITKISKEEFGHIVLLKLLDCVDDTVLVSKQILNEVKKNLMEVVQDKYGRLVLLQLLVPGNKRYFPQVTLDLLQPVLVPSAEDPNKLVSTSKKDPEIRRLELWNTMQKDMIAMLKRFLYKVITNFQAREVLLETIIATTDAKIKQDLYDAILDWVDFDAEAMAQRIQEEDEEESQLMRELLQENAKLETQLREERKQRAAEIALKHKKAKEAERTGGNVEDDEEPQQPQKGKGKAGQDVHDHSEVLVGAPTKKVKKVRNPLEANKEKEPRDDLMVNYSSSRTLRRIIEEEPDFAPLLLNKIKDKIETYATSKGASFVVLSLLECDTTQQEVKDLLTPHLAALKQSAESGSKVLVKHLTGSATIKKQKLQDLGDAAYIPGQDKMEVEHEPKKQAKPAQAKANAKAEPKQATKPAQGKPAQAKPGQAKPGQAKPAQTKAEPKQAAKPAQGKPAQTQAKQQNGTSAKPAANGNGAAVAKKTNDAAPMKKAGAFPTKKVGPPAEQTKAATAKKPVNNNAAKPKKVAKK